MTDERKLEIVRQFKEEIYKRFNLNVMSDENLETVIEQMIVEKLGSEYITIEERVDIMERVYSSIRGLGVLDSIIKDDDITEVMINGPKDIFIEKAGKLSKLNQTFDDEKQLEDIIQKIVGQAGREVNQANPIVDTRLPDGSRVNVVLPPISLNGATGMYTPDIMSWDDFKTYYPDAKEIGDTNVPGLLYHVEAISGQSVAVAVKVSDDVTLQIVYEGSLEDEIGEDELGQRLYNLVTVK